MNVIPLIDIAIQAAIKAGEKIMDVYTTVSFKIQYKADNTPVTLADRKAHNEIMKILKPTHLPVLSEEGVHLSYEERKDWDMFWLVDPLDGTKEFINRNDEFTVNIALIYRNRPIAGVIYVPVTRELYVGIPDIGAWKVTNPSSRCTLQSLQLSRGRLPKKNNPEEYVVVVSRSHINSETEDYIQTLREKHDPMKVIRLGSSLKICRVAEGTAAIYPKLGLTMEWDTAAGHAIAKAAGKNIFLPDLKTELTYNKEDLHNPHFIVI
jgi:3'(2'), 5'-bisphosphate nucleotidase